MGFFNRLGQVIKGKASGSISSLENANPAAVYEAAILERERKYGELKKAMAGLVHMRDQRTKALAEAERELTQVRPSLAMAVDSGEDEAALVLIERQDTLDAKVAELKEELVGLDAQVKESSAGLLQFKDEIARLKREKTEMLARNAGADARIKVQETVDGLSTDADVKGLANVRERIQAMTESVPDVEVRSVQADMARLRAKAQLEQMKRKRKGEPEPEANAPVEEGEADPVPDEDPEVPDAPKRTL